MLYTFFITTATHMKRNTHTPSKHTVHTLHKHTTQILYKMENDSSKYITNIHHIAIRPHRPPVGHSSRRASGRGDCYSLTGQCAGHSSSLSSGSSSSTTSALASVPKYRSPKLPKAHNAGVSAELSESWTPVYRVRKINGTPNHVHLLIRESKVISDQDFMAQLKGDSSRWMNRTFTGRPRFSWQG